MKKSYHNVQNQIKKENNYGKTTISFCFNGRSKETQKRRHYFYRIKERNFSDILFWNSDSDEPDYELETTNGFVDINSIYLPKDDNDNEETIEVISRQAVMDTLVQTYFKYESERLDAIQNLPIYTIPKPEEN